MHALIGFSVVVGLIALAFGGEAAIGFVRTCLFIAGILMLAGLTYVAVDVWNAP